MVPFEVVALAVVAYLMSDTASYIHRVLTAKKTGKTMKIGGEECYIVPKEEYEKAKFQSERYVKLHGPGGWVDTMKEVSEEWDAHNMPSARIRPYEKGGSKE
jgi:hypothetical protein